MDNHNLQELGREDEERRPIPTIVNGVTNMNSSSKYKQKSSNVPNDSFNHFINNLLETINEHNKREHSSSNKHRIILVGDSHVEGFASSLKSILHSDYDLFSVVKPGSSSNELKESAKEITRQLSHEDLIVICSSTSDLELNNLSVTFQNIMNYLMNNNHSNILLLNIPFRYDLPNSYAANKKISTLNKSCRN